MNHHSVAASFKLHRILRGLCATAELLVITYVTFIYSDHYLTSAAIGK